MNVESLVSSYLIDDVTILLLQSVERNDLAATLLSSRYSSLYRVDALVGCALSPAFLQSLLQSKQLYYSLCSCLNGGCLSV